MNLPVAPRELGLEFRKFTGGANAFALPGGIIVVSDGMVEIVGAEQRLLAVLAHEIGHVEMRHGVRRILESSAVALIAGAVTADVASIGSSVASLPSLLMQSGYSREHEEEADEFAFGLLLAHGITPDAFAEAMTLLESQGSRQALTRLDYLSTHPATDKRIERARAAGRR